jgi:hypothetical protein
MDVLSIVIIATVCAMVGMYAAHLYYQKYGDGVIVRIY